ncbi:TPA: hypothetical protein N0F65_006202 [Lagenidium giganteum]|uniref:J domain-containing protein n=1 Tax=Lagenidium giganteum TaxID=4803 RepID=A0AAV2Z9K6_9STRA|nr:TPA: hypothetical protein N0F65_006202 [Lagenidium giganteum]
MATPSPTASAALSSPANTRKRRHEDDKVAVSQSEDKAPKQVAQEPPKKRARKSKPNKNKSKSTAKANRASQDSAKAATTQQQHVVDLTGADEENSKPAQRSEPSVTPQEQRAMDQLESDDYFEVLGVARSASEADIKKAYRKLAVQWHPDKNRTNPRAEEFFKNIAEAYEVLSDPEKRKIYERYGKEGLEGKSSGSGGAYNDHFGSGGRAGFSARHARDIFEAFFGGMDPFEEFFGAAMHNGRRGSGRGHVDPMLGFPMRGFGGGMMMDSFFSDPFGGMDGFGSMLGGMSMGMSMGGGGISKSVSSSSYTDRNGHVVMKKTTTTVDANGRTETVTEEYKNGNLVSSSSSTKSRLAGAGRMQLEGGGTSDKNLGRQGSAGRSKSRGFF